jgi:cAMP-dependent protein kinase regulator
MTDSLRQAKDRAAELFAKGKLSAALEQYQRIAKAVPNDVNVRQKMAELLSRLGKKSEAAAVYLDVVGRYAEAGQFFKAIALCKVILRLDPSHIAAQEELAALYSRTRVATTPKAAAPVGDLSLATLQDEPLGAAVVDDAEPELLLDVVAEEGPPPAMVGGALPVIPLFSQLTREEFIAVLQEGMEVHATPPDGVIVKEGDEGSSMYAIVQGHVGVLRGGSKVASMIEGDFLGEMALMSKSKRLATVVAESDVVVLEFPRAAMEKLFGAHPGVQAALDAFYRERLLANLLRASPLLSPLSADEKIEVAGKFEVKTFEAGHVILVQGQPGDGLYMVLRGRCGVMDRSGKRYPALIEGDAFGEISVGTGQSVTANVRAESQVVALKLSAEAVRALVLTNPQVKAALVQLGNERLERSRSMDLRV